jgi:hypothetical protein
MTAISTSIKLKVLKELIATVFINANQLSVSDGLTFKYKSYPHEDLEFKGWKFDLIVAELGYGEKTIQEFRFHRPENIDPKNMEFHVITEIFTRLVQTSLVQWYELGKLLAVDKEFQKQAKESLHGEQENIITSDK